MAAAAAELYDESAFFPAGHVTPVVDISVFREKHALDEQPFGPGYKLAGKEVLFTDGCFSRVVFYVEGHHRELLCKIGDKLICGLSGPETRIAEDIIRPVGSIYVLPRPGSAPDAGTVLPKY
jgi:hypothetical protein